MSHGFSAYLLDHLVKNCFIKKRSWAEETKKRGRHETVVAVKIALILNRSRPDPYRDLKFAAYLHGTVQFIRAKFG